MFRRIIGEQTLLCTPRTGGCLVLKNAQVFLDVIFAYWPDEEKIVSEVAAKYGLRFEEVFDDVQEMIGLLVRERFLVRGDNSEGRATSMTPPNGIGNARAVGSSNPPNRGSYDFDGNRRDDSWTPLGEFYRRHNLPCELHIDLTDRCNERCVHCYIPKGVGKLIDDTIFYKAAKEFREAQGMTLYVSGGECMLHPKFFDYLRYARELNLNIIVMSNLTLCDDAVVAKFKEIDPQFINVSLYSMDAAVHDAITQTPGSWQKTMGAILALEKAGVPVRIATPVTRLNKDSIPALREFTTAHRMHLIADCDIFGRIDHDCSNQSHSLSPEEMEQVLLANRETFRQMPADPERCGCDAKVCDIGEARLNLNAYGDYYPCDGFHGMVLGNAAEVSVLDVWRGGKLNTLRALKNKDFGACASCTNRAWCKVCPMRNFNETGDLFKHAPERCAAAAIKRKIFEEM